MSDDHNPTPAAVLELPTEAEEDGDNVSRASETSEVGKKRELLALEKLACLKHLIQAVDTLIYIELFILYYMEYVPTMLLHDIHEERLTVIW